MTKRSRDRVPCGSMLDLTDPRRPDSANPPTNIWWSLFLTALAWSTCTGQTDKEYYVEVLKEFRKRCIQASKIGVESWEFSLLLLYILWDNWPIFMISALNKQLQQELEYTLLKPDCHSWWISENEIWTLEERYAIKFCFKLGKNVTGKYGMLQTVFNHLAWIKHQFLSGIRDSRKAGSLWGMMRGVRGVRKSIHQSRLAKELGLGLGLLCWGFKGVQEEIPWEEASTLQIESVAFPSGQYTSLHLHPCHRLFDQDMHQDSSSPSSSPDLAPCD